MEIWGLAMKKVPHELEEEVSFRVSHITISECSPSSESLLRPQEFSPSALKGRTTSRLSAQSLSLK